MNGQIARAEIVYGQPETKSNIYPDYNSFPIKITVGSAYTLISWDEPRLNLIHISRQLSRPIYWKHVNEMREIPWDLLESARKAQDEWHGEKKLVSHMSCTILSYALAWEDMISIPSETHASSPNQTPSVQRV